MKPSTLKPVFRTLTLLWAVMFFVSSSEATTAIMLTDEQLATSSRVIVLGEVKSVKAQWDIAQQSISTYVKLQISKVIKGELQNQEIVFKQLGGTVGDSSTFIYGAPEYRVGQRLLLFLDTTRDGTLRIAHFFQGKYDVIEDAGTGQSRIERNIDGEMVNILGVREGPEVTNESSLKIFTRKIRKLLRENSTDVAEAAAKFQDIPIVEVPPEYVDDGANEPQPGDVGPQYTFLGSFRWFEPDAGQPVSYRVNSSNPPIATGGITEINQAMAAWSNVQTTALVIQNSGSTTAFGFRNDSVSAISFNDPLDQMSDPVGCSGTLAIGGVSSAGGATRIIGGRSWSQIFEGDVVFNRNFSCFLGISANLAEVATHEIGHSIGFGHSADTSAIMFASARGNGRGATLGSDDIAAVTYLYPGSKSTPPPTVPAPPSGLSAGAISTSAINISWADNSTNETGFRLERKTGLSGTYALIATLPAGQTTYQNTGLAASTTYYYRVKAYNTAGESTFSNEASAATQGTALTNNASFVSQSVPATMSTRQSTSVTVTMRNTGTATWAAGTYYIGSQNPPGNSTWGLNRVNLASAAAPGANASINFSITAPANAGTYNFQWQMAANGVASFGSMSPVVAIVVSVRPQSVDGDFDADSKADIGVFRPSTGTWYIIKSSSGSFLVQQWGSPGDVSVPADYDGDGKADIAVFRPSTRVWYIVSSVNGAFTIQQWGSVGDLPAAADYDGDGRSDIAVYRPSTGTWNIVRSSGGSLSIQWGSPGDVPVPLDYDGDGRADTAVYRPSTGNWYIINSSNGANRIQQWGSPGDLSVPADYDRDGKADFAVFRPSTGNWYIINSSNGTFTTRQWGSPGDKPVPADYDGDGRVDIGIYRPSTGTWYIIRSFNGSFIIQQWGSPGDIPTP